MFRFVSGKEFCAALVDSPTSPLFEEMLGRLVPFDALMNEQAAVCDSPLKVSGSLRAPALCTLITGDLDVGDVLDLGSDYDEDGLFVVVGNVRCRHFIGHYSTCCVVDGDLDAKLSLMNGFGDSGLWVVGTLTTRLFIGADIWAEVGAGAVMDYGVGYCLPIGYTIAGADAIWPRHSEKETAELVLAEPNAKGYLFRVEQFVDRIRAGRPIFKQEPQR
jgi:hypothetical protein